MKTTISRGRVIIAAPKKRKKPTCWRCMDTGSVTDSEGDLVLCLYCIKTKETEVRCNNCGGKKWTWSIDGDKVPCSSCDQQAYAQWVT